MNDLISNILRGSVSSVMYVLLLATLTKPKLGRKGTVVVVTFVFLLNMAVTIWFYLYGDLTGLSRFTVVMFLIIGLAFMRLPRLNFMQWALTFLTTINIAMMIIILSFHLGRLFPQPQYANTIIRLVLYLTTIFIFRRFLLVSYRAVVNNWPIFSTLIVCIFLNLSYYFFVTDNIQNTLVANKWPLILLVALSIAAYGTMFYALRKFAIMHAVQTENQKIQKESEILHETALQLDRYAHYDMLTGLPNRRYFFETLNSMTADHEKDRGSFALLYIDLDNYKHINDTHGHEVGDEVLVTIGNRLKECSRETDFVARLGGDEFAIIMHQISNNADVENLTRKIHTAIQEIIHVGTIECSTNASIGVAIYPDSGKDGETLLRNADSAMYKIKKSGKAGMSMHTDQL